MASRYLDSASAMSRLKARSATGLRRCRHAEVGAFGRQQRLDRTLLAALTTEGADGLARLRQRPAERQRRPEAITERVLRLDDGHVVIVLALLEEGGLWEALDFLFLKKHQRTEQAPALSLALNL